MSLHKRDRLMLEWLKEAPRSFSELEQLLKNSGINYTERSIQRRLPILKSRGYPIVRLIKGKKKYHVWKWQNRPSYERPDQIEQQKIEDYQALAIALAERYWSISALPERKQSLTKLFEEAHEQLVESDSYEARWYKKARAIDPSYWLKAPSLNNQVFEEIRRALLREEPLSICYKSHDRDEPSEFIVTPLGIYFRGRVAYLISFDHDNNKTRNRPISRIVGARELLLESSQIPNEFDIDTYIEGSAITITYGVPFRLEAIIFDSVEREISDAHLGENQIISPYGEDERFKLLEVDVPFTLDLIQWLLARTAYLKVIGPDNFKEKFDEEIRRGYMNAMSDAPDVPKEKTFE